MAQAKVFQLQCAAQEYAWGKVGSESKVAELSKGGNPNFTLKEDVTYAELWMGTHHKAPSVILPGGTALSSWLQENNTALGQKVWETFPTEGQLPFLFKVLSVNKSLSIQAHPNKSLAEVLHTEKPDKYPDSNHKPEMAIALTPFEGLCGFRPNDEIIGFFDRIAEFREICGLENVESLRKATEDNDVQKSLKLCFSALMNASADVIKSKVDSLAARITVEGLGDDFESELFLRLNTQFPGDCGCFVIYFLNHMRLEPGEAMFLEANLPHAYLSGDCMECMACSDNVVRAGLTPKFKDVPTLCAMLNYACKPPSDNLFPSVPDSKDPCVTLYDPPIPDFTVSRIQVPQSRKSYTIQSLDSASIALVVRGAGKATNQSAEGPISLTQGTVLFISAGEEVELALSSEGMLIFRAYCHL